MHVRTEPACRLCGAPDVDVDEVLEAGVLCLAECRRCDHRWTERPLYALTRQLEWAEPEVAEAA
jgi:hypothetical protein